MISNESNAFLFDSSIEFVPYPRLISVVVTCVMSDGSGFVAGVVDTDGLDAHINPKDRTITVKPIGGAS